MASVCNEIPFEFKKKAHRLCRTYLGGSWKNVPFDEFSIEVLRYVSLKFILKIAKVLKVFDIQFRRPVSLENGIERDILLRGCKLPMFFLVAK